MITHDLCDYRSLAERLAKPCDTLERHAEGVHCEVLM
jgi:hypothetical protein